MYFYSTNLLDQALGDWFIASPNAAGILLTIIQFFLKFFYESPAQAEADECKNERIRMEEEELVLGDAQITVVLPDN